MLACNHWLMRLHELAVRHAGLGLVGDLSALTVTELWGVFCFLCRTDGGIL